MNRFSSRLCLVAMTCATVPALAQDDIPSSSGFSGYLLAGPGYFRVATSVVKFGAPLLEDASDAQIDSIFESPSSKNVPGLLTAGEINYTFAGTRTQVFFGNRLEDWLRLDLAFGLGVRQELGDGSILAGSVLTTPIKLKHWKDPYVEGEDREGTEFDSPGLRVRWGRILGSGLELTATYRRFKVDDERSGDWLVDEGRLDPADRAALDRNGNGLRVQFLYRIDVNRKHRFEPTLRLVNDEHDGEAIANRGYDLKLTYLYLTPKVLLDANVLVGQRKANETNPVYDESLDTDRLGVALAAFVPIKTYATSRLSWFVGAEVLDVDANLDFYESGIATVNGGLVWRHIRK